MGVAYEYVLVHNFFVVAIEPRQIKSMLIVIIIEEGITSFGGEEFN